jgi:hypothetical protein
MKLIYTVLEKYCIGVSAIPPDSTSLIPFLHMWQTSINSNIRFLAENYVNLLPYYILINHSEIITKCNSLTHLSTNILKGCQLLPNWRQNDFDEDKCLNCPFSTAPGQQQRSGVRLDFRYQLIMPSNCKRTEQ